MKEIMINLKPFTKNVEIRVNLFLWNSSFNLKIQVVIIEVIHYRNLDRQQTHLDLED